MRTLTNALFAAASLLTISAIGHACPPGQKETREMDVSLSVGKVSKSARVYGDRQWKDGKITAPTAFKTMAMVYEKAYGGLYIQEGQIADADTRNPVGRGFSGKRSSKDMNGVPLPNLEDPSRLIQKHDDQPAVAGFGFCAPNWQPRVSHAGTYDEHWKTNRAPYLPEDFDSRFLNMAHPDLVYPGFAQGGELVSIQGMHPRGSLEFEIPQVGLVTRVQMADTEYLPLLNLETIILEPNALRISMVWRAALPCDKKALKVSEIKINLTS